MTYDKIRQIWQKNPNISNVNRFQTRSITIEHFSGRFALNCQMLIVTIEHTTCHLIIHIEMLLWRFFSQIPTDFSNQLIEN